MIKVFANRKLVYGYAETSTRRRPKEPEIVFLGWDEIEKARCLGAYLHPDGNSNWLVFKIPNVKRYYFQIQPW